ncbi:hypothetical protein LEP1GSC084_1113 [Leptospira interrogans serovar Medanensis str. L0448]|nr:hypothetical protein LEP1GSC084_1113 [Leptospira interrogans serovar Medanensis str. L0448]
MELIRLQLRFACTQTKSEIQAATTASELLAIDVNKGWDPP